MLLWALYASLYTLLNCVYKVLEKALYNLSVTYSTIVRIYFWCVQKWKIEKERFPVNTL